MFPVSATHERSARVVGSSPLVAPARCLHDTGVMAKRCRESCSRSQVVEPLRDPDAALMLGAVVKRLRTIARRARERHDPLKKPHLFPFDLRRNRRVQVPPCRCPSQEHADYNGERCSTDDDHAHCAHRRKHRRRARLARSVRVLRRDSASVPECSGMSPERRTASGRSGHGREQHVDDEQQHH